MDVIRRDTDYAFRLAATLARRGTDGLPMSARSLSQQTHVSYALTCKLLQKLAAAGIVSSTMGPKGGFVLAKRPEAITFGQVIEAIQGQVSVIRCLMGDFKCPLKCACPVNPKLKQMQQQIDGFLNEATLAEFIQTERQNKNG